MISINLAALPNQSLSINLENQFYELVIKETNGVMAITIYRNNVLILENTRLLPFTPLIPYPYLEDGNLFVTSENGEIPWYEAFGVTQNLYYLNPSELEAIRA